jgi:Fe-Mn family superoxide dismutase
MTFTLPALPFEANALEPHISAETIGFHYGKHHQAYLNNLNKLSAGTEYADMTLEEVIHKAEGGLFNNAAQVFNHSFYWNSLSPNGGGEPKGALAEAITDDFGSFQAFVEAFSSKAATLFGSGWTWLVINGKGKLEIIQTSNAATVITKGLTPILTCDVWEHAYYIDYRNARPTYIEAFWNLVNWDFANANYTA